MLRHPLCPRRSKDHSNGRGFILAPFQAGRIAWRHGSGARASTRARRCAYVCSRSMEKLAQYLLLRASMVHAFYLGTSEKPVVLSVFVCMPPHRGYFDAGASKQRKASNEAAPVAVTRKQASQDFAAAMMVLYTVSEVYTSAMSPQQEHSAMTT